MPARWHRIIIHMAAATNPDRCFSPAPPAEARGVSRVMTLMAALVFERPARHYQVELSLRLARSGEGKHMKSETMSVQQLFQDRRQYRVPFFQRPYVWNKEDQWERLWTDISEKAEARLDGSPSVPHFLGAAVLEPQQRSGLLGVETLNVIDGQQRFTTLQYFLAALAMILRDEKQTTLLSLTDGCLWNASTGFVDRRSHCRHG
jgi:hypothetical protein